ncbi:MAG: hypothetical protein QXO75_12090 [Nitrososphaerota archaeon]
MSQIIGCYIRIFLYGRMGHLSLRIDSFSSVTVKRNESSLLPPDITEIYSGLKGITHWNPLKKLFENEIMKIAYECINQMRSVNREAKGRWIS